MIGKKVHSLPRTLSSLSSGNLQIEREYKVTTSEKNIQLEQNSKILTSNTPEDLQRVKKYIEHKCKTENLD